MTHTLNRRHFLFASVSLAALAGCADTGAALRGPMKKDITLIALRHADRDAGSEELNSDGIARAAALPAALADYPIDAIYSPGFQRNLDTAAPLSKARNVPVQNIPANSIASVLAQSPDKSSVVWIGNKENLKELWVKTGAPGEPPLEYGQLFVVQFYTDRPAWVSQLQFGK